MKPNVNREALLERLERAAKRGITGAEIEQQRISFVLASLDRDSKVTREQVVEWIGKQPA